MPLSKAEFDQWAGRHGAMFGFAHANDSAMFSLWFGLFADRGYSPAELRYATDSIAAKTEPLKWREHHLAEINKLIGDRRGAYEAKRLRDFPEDNYGPSRCSSCEGSGWVSVPSPRQIVDKRWEPSGMHVHALAVVACNCPQGQKKLDGWDASPSEFQKRIPRPMMQSYYEQQICSHWRGLVRDYEEKLAAILKANALSEQADKSRPLTGPIKKVLESVAK